MGKLTTQEFSDGLKTEFNDKVGSAKLTTELDKKANFSHTHSIANITGLQSEIDTLKSSVSSGKTAVAAAVTGKGVAASGSDSFPALAGKIDSIKVGYAAGDIAPVEKVEPIYGAVKKVTQDWAAPSTSNVGKGGFHLGLEDSYFGSVYGFYALSGDSGATKWQNSEYTYRSIGTGNYVFYQMDLRVCRRNIDGTGLVSFPTFQSKTSGGFGEILLDSTGNVVAAAGPVWDAASTKGAVYKYNQAGTLLWSNAVLGSGYSTVGDIYLGVDEEDSVYAGCKDKVLRKFTSSGNDISSAI